jgi:hypothetical protein
MVEEGRGARMLGERKSEGEGGVRSSGRARGSGCAGHSQARAPVGSGTGVAEAGYGRAA